MSDFKKFAPKKNVTDDVKLALEGERWNKDDHKRPLLKLRVVNSKGNKNSEVKTITVGVWFTVYMNHPEESDDSPAVNLKMDAKIASTFIEMIEEAINDPNIPMRGMDIIGYDFFGGKRADKPSSQGSIHVGRNGNNELCLIVQSKNRPRAIFPFTPSFYYNLIDKNGEKLDTSVASSMIAKGWIKLIRPILALVTSNVYDDKVDDPEAPANKGSYGNSGGYNKGSYNGNNNKGGYEKKSYNNNNSNYNKPKPKQTDVFDDMH